MILIGEGLKLKMEKINDSIYRVAIPLPFQLNKIYAYAVKGENGWTLIDTGLHNKETEIIWEKFLNEQQSTWRDIEKIILTHYHPDHYGAAGWLQEKSGAPVCMAKEDHEAARLFWHSNIEMGKVMKSFYLQHGMPDSLAEQMIDHMNEFIPWVTPAPVVTYIKEGDRILIGDLTYEVFATPGHSDGHLCFYQPEKKWLFSGDHILPKITPNVSLWPEGTDRNPLIRFISSLKKIRQLDIQTAFPAHKTLCTDVKKRIDDLLFHHEERLNHVMNWIGNKATGYEVCEKMFGSNLSVHQLRFAMAETLAHLVYLEGENRIFSKQHEGKILWFPVK